MAPELSRPPTRNGGSRPPTSRFQEGSMNDRISNVPPVQFLGDEQLKEYEKQFYNEPLRKATTAATAILHREARRQRRDRPLSASAQLQSPVSSRVPVSQTDDQPLQHKRSTGFFGRVRDALFNRGGPPAPAQKLQQEEDEVRRKHSSLQEPVQAPSSSMPPPPRPDFLQRSPKSQSETNIPQLPNFGGSDRPSRDDVMASYQELMARGFFQSHAIQSTRHAGPSARRSAPLMPSIPSAPCTPQPPPRFSSMNAPTSPESPTSATKGRVSNDCPIRAPPPTLPQFLRSPPPKSAAQSSAPPAASRPELPRKDSRYALRGRKRSRADADDGTTMTTSESTASFAQPLKRVAKKLRKMPSSITSSSSNSNSSTTTTTASTSAQNADGVLKLAPSLSNGGTLHSNERALRMRSPSPPPVTVVDINGNGNGGGNVNRRIASISVRRTFSGSNRLRKRAKSPARTANTITNASASASTVSTTPETWGMMRQRMSIDSTRDSGDNERKGSSAFASPRGVDAAEPVVPLCAVPDANRGIPSVPKIPFQFFDKTPRPSSDENDRGNRMDVDVDGEWQFGEAL
ncbi:Uu.00g071770.m01.CDS01 [Anthostomella pinea]|uniref:Uu.00g071770.m01.CDS01 n=1 Tax=Anthostomella pinea TaxID=933095 RepID=A0AAI8YLD9_9PEZI|nr:Uu.00g071770.m01.CDS01 [Anthostomella pinea]